MTLYQAWSDFCQSARDLLWTYSPETIFFAGILIGMMCGLMLAALTYPGLL